MFCSNCGKELKNENQKFCTYCGAKIAEQERNIEIENEETFIDQEISEKDEDIEFKNKTLGRVIDKKEEEKFVGLKNLKQKILDKRILISIGILILVLLLSIVGAVFRNPKELYVVSENTGKKQWNYIDETGKIHFSISKEKYDHVSNCYNERIIAFKEKEILPFNYCQTFHKGDIFILNNKGKVIKTIKNILISEATCGMGVAGTIEYPDFKFGTTNLITSMGGESFDIDKNGNIIKKYFSFDDIAVAKGEQKEPSLNTEVERYRIDDNFGYRYRMNGQIIIPAQFRIPHHDTFNSYDFDFHNGVALVPIVKKERIDFFTPEEWTCRYIKMDGSYINSDNYSCYFTVPFYNKVIPTCTDSNPARCGYINTKGEWVYKY